MSEPTDDTPWWREGGVSPRHSIFGNVKSMMVDTARRRGVTLDTVDDTWIVGDAHDEEGSRRQAPAEDMALDRHDALHEALAANGFRLLFRERSKVEGTVFFLYVRPDALLQVDPPGHAVGMHMTTLGGEAMADLEPKVKAVLSDLFPQVPVREDRGAMYMLSSNARGSLAFVRTRPIGIPLTRTNYPDAVLADYDRVCRDLLLDRPPGRLVILEGPPGTGKTHMAIGLLHALAEEAAFVLVPPAMLESLTSHRMMPELEEFISTQHRKQVRVILLIEDADEILLPRGRDNMGAISTLLNLGDGILGRLLDLRIVCTTNARKVEIDDAVLRKMRLLARMEMGPLTNAQAAAAYGALRGCSGVMPADWTRDAHVPLASVYERLHRDGWTPPPLPPAPPVGGAARWRGRPDVGGRMTAQPKPKAAMLARTTP